MKKIVSVLLLMVFGCITAQNEISWEKEVKDLGNNEFEIIMTANMQKGWHVYTPDVDKINEFALPTTVTVKKSKGIQLIGKSQVKGEAIEEKSEAFGDIKYFKGNPKYIQKVKVTDSKAVSVDVIIDYQICNDKVCLAPETLVKKITLTPTVQDKPKEEPQKEEPTEEVQTSEFMDSSASIVPPSDTISTSSNSQSDHEQSLIIPSLDIKNPIAKECSGTTETSEDYWVIFLLGFAGGLIALLTPCVFPMIPLTISYFTKSHEKGSGRANALLYAAFIFLIFISLSIPFYILDNVSDNIFNVISTSPVLNIFFFVVFIVFAISFFGYFEITLPSSWLNKADQASNVGGIIGVFFMALTLILVSFSCTGPILGTMLATALNSPIGLTAALAGFGFSWALIFGGFALFPGVLASLPKSGGWMNTFKVILGFIELALALKFLSKADLVTTTFMIKRELFVFLWIVIAVLTALYLLGFIRFPHDERPAKVGWWKRIWAFVFLAFALYLFPGLYPTPEKSSNLTLLSGILPPAHVSYFNDGTIHCPLGLTCYHDYFEAIEVAKREDKPVLIDFTGYGCENCRKMEENVWSDPEVLKILENDVVLASLYVDEKEELPEEEQTTIDLGNDTYRLITTHGDKWSVFESANFGQSSQPYYVMVTPDHRVINLPSENGYNGSDSKDIFLEFLQCGVATYKNSK